MSLEYIEFETSEGYSVLYEDGYASFGWMLSEKKEVLPAKVLLRFKRDRKIRNKAELTRMQRQFDSVVRDIIHLESAKKNLAAISSISLGIIGCAFFAGSVFSLNNNHLFLCILFAITGFLSWIVPFFLYKKMVEIKTIQVTPQIEANYDVLYEISERGTRLI